MLLVKTCDFFLYLFSVKKEHEIRFNDVLNRKETFFDYKNKIFQRLKNGILPKGLTHAFGQKIQFFHCNFFSLKIRLEVRVNNVLDRKKKYFFCYKDKIFHSLRNHIFPKGLTHAFVKKSAFFYLCSVKTRLEIVLTEFVDKK